MKDKLYNRALAWVKNRGFKEIKANTEDFETPKAFSKADEDTQVIPDITGRRHGRKSYIEIVSKDGNKQDIITKWKLMCTLASMRGGKLYLLAARGYKTFATNIIKEYNLTDAKVVSI